MAVLRGQRDLDGGLWLGMALQARQLSGEERGDKWGPTCQAGGSDGWVFCGCLAGDLSREWIQK